MSKPILVQRLWHRTWPTELTQTQHPLLDLEAWDRAGKDTTSEHTEVQAKVLPVQDTP